ncbi:hypothetical protein [Halobaculum sp. EA56]|uniref:hypothetical protein n=1 Tax=Halobaculum sp. EA56 TaxID=3421648 RepID=UPI003EBB787E
MSDTADPSDHGEAGDAVDPDAQDADRARPEDAGGADTVPEVELGLYQVSVRVKGQADDDLGEVEEAATRLIDHLVERASTLEEEPDQRGLG